MPCRPGTSSTCSGLRSGGPGQGSEHHARQSGDVQPHSLFQWSPAKPSFEQAPCCGSSRCCAGALHTCACTLGLHSAAGIALDEGDAAARHVLEEASRVAQALAEPGGILSACGWAGDVGHQGGQVGRGGWPAELAAEGSWPHDRGGGAGVQGRSNREAACTWHTRQHSLQEASSHAKMASGLGFTRMWMAVGWPLGAAGS